MNKLILTALLVASGVTQAAELDWPLSAYCSATEQFVQMPGGCPAIHEFSVGANLQTTQTDATITIGGDVNTTGTAHVCAATISFDGNSALKQACLDNDTGLIITKQTSAFTGPATNTVTLTGLPSGGGVFFHSMFRATSGNYQNRPVENDQSGFVTMLSGGGGGGDDLTGLVKVVTQSGAGLRDGTSVANAFSYSDFRSYSAALGEDFCFMDDEVYTDASGFSPAGGTSSDDNRHIGCYVDTGDSSTLKEYDTGTTTGRGSKPIFRPSSSTSGGFIGTSGGQDYVTFEHVDFDGQFTPSTRKVAPTAYIGKMINEATGNTNWTWENVKVDHVRGYACFEIESGSDDWTFRNVYFEYCGVLETFASEGSGAVWGDWIEGNGADRITIINSTIRLAGHNHFNIKDGTGHYIGYNDFYNLWCTHYGEAATAGCGYRIGEMDGNNYVIELNDLSGVDQPRSVYGGNNPYMKVMGNDGVVRGNLMANSGNPINSMGIKADDELATGSYRIRFYNNDMADVEEAFIYKIADRTPVGQITYDFDVKNNVFRGNSTGPDIEWDIPSAYRLDSSDVWDDADFVDNCFTDASPSIDPGSGGITVASANSTYTNWSDNTVSCTPGADSGSNLTLVNQTGGTGTDVDVDDALWFVIGDVLNIGGDVVTVTALTDTNITFTPSITWADNDAVNLNVDATPGQGNTLGTPGDPD